MNSLGFNLQLISGIWILFVPKIMLEAGYPPGITIFGGGLLFIFLFFFQINTISIDSKKPINLIQLFLIGILLFQSRLEINTIYSITAFAIGLTIFYLTNPYIQVISRTQVYSSQGYVSDEILNAMQNSNRYLVNQLAWVVQTIGIILIATVVTLIGILIMQILPSTVNLYTLQIISMGAFLLLIGFIVYYVFPSLEDKPKSYS